MDIKNDKVEEIIERCREDMIDLKIIMYQETNADMKLVWEYQYELNREIIKNLVIDYLSVLLS